jgi:hypothetical protein
MSQDLEKLLSRLETVTTRLESYAASSTSHGIFLLAILSLFLFKFIKTKKKVVK